MDENLNPVLRCDASPPHTPRQTSTAIIIVCWVVILAIVGLEFWLNIDRSKAAADTLSENQTLSAIAHCIVGAHALTVSGAKNVQPDAVAPLVTQMETVAKTPVDRLRVAIICKEVSTPALASDRLSALDRIAALPPVIRDDLNVLHIIYRDGPAALSDSQRQSFLEHQGWFGQVALSYGLPDTAPQRSRMLDQAKRAFLVSTSAVVVGGGGMVLGACLMILAIILAATGRLPLWFRPGMADTVFLEAFAVYLAGFVLISLLIHAVVQSPGLGWTLVLTVVLPVAACWPVVRGKSWTQTRLELGWHLGRGIFWEMGCGIVGYLAALPLLAIMLIITFQLIRLSGTTPTHPVVNYLGGGRGEIALIYFIACIWAPVFEESMFRGALFNHLRSRHGWWLSAGLVGLLFAAVHPQGWTTIPVLGGIGMVLCGLREWRGSLVASMTAHALNNGTVITLALLTSR
jgi:membrane protease YdiL (CAAX protease family)